MQFYDFITQDELDELPEDSEAAFTEFVQIAQRRLRDYTRDNPPSDSFDYEALNEVRHSFVNIVVAAAKRYAIEPFSSMEVPVITNFDSDRHKQFRADLDHYITQLVVGNTIRGKRDTVHLPPATKDKVRSYVLALREAVEKAEMGEAKRTALLDKLKAFEAELEKRRLSLLELTRITVAIAAVPGGLWASGDVTMKLVTNVMQAVGEAKVAEEEARLVIAPMPMRALSAPRNEVLSRKAQPRDPDFSVDLDDEIPF